MKRVSLVRGLLLITWPALAWADSVPVRHDAEVDSSRVARRAGQGGEIRVGRCYSPRWERGPDRDRHRDEPEGKCEALLLFDLRALPSRALETATLRVFVGEVGSSGRLDVRPILGPWHEDTVSAHGAPPLGDVLVSAEVTRAAARRFLQMDVTPLVAEWLSGGSPNRGLALGAGEDSGLRMLIDSKENVATSHAAEIEVVWAAVPGPPGPAGPTGPPGGIDPGVVAGLQSQITELRARVDQLTAFASPIIDTQSPLPDGRVGAAYSQGLAATGGSPPYRWAVVGGSLPEGLALSPDNGVVSGAPTGPPGAHSLLVQVTDANGHVGLKAFTLTALPRSGALLDLVLLVDTTGSMGGPIANLKNGMIALVQQVQTEIDPGARFGVAEYQDFPFGDFGGPLDVPYRVHQVLTTSTNDVRTAINGLSLGYGGDWPEAGNEALYMAATGQGVSWPGGSVPGAPLGFRPGARRVIALFTDAVFHDPAEYAAGGIIGLHSETQAVEALVSAGIAVISVLRDVAPPFPRSPNETRDQLTRYARATGAVVPVTSFPVTSVNPSGQCGTGISGAGRPPDSDGMCPLVFLVDQTGVGSVESLHTGLALLAAGSASSRPAQDEARSGAPAAPGRPRP